MATYLVLPPGTGPNVTTTAWGGRSYSATPGASLSVNSFDSHVLAANGWIQVCETGATSVRPSPAPRGRLFYDTTITKFVVFDGVTWRDPTTGTAS